MRSFDVWRRSESPQGVARYRCFEDLITGMFCVQSYDFYPLSITTKGMAESDKQFVELLIEQSPFERSGSFESIDAAIADHDSTFSEE